MIYFLQQSKYLVIFPTNVFICNVFIKGFFIFFRYIKALEAIRKFRKEQSNELKVFNTQLEYLKENKLKANEV